MTKFIIKNTQEAPLEKEWNIIYLGINNEYNVNKTKEIIIDTCPTNKPYLSMNENIHYNDFKNNFLHPFSTEKG